MKVTALVGAVFDCNVFLQAASREKSVAAECLRFVEKGLVRLYVCKDVLAEVEDVLNRPEIRNHFQTLSDEIVEAFILRLQKISEIIRSVPKEFSYSRDPDDEVYINLAVRAEADYLVSRDKDLLDLMTAYTIEAKQFRQRFRPLIVIEPLEFLKEMRKLESRNIID
ncbi:MAG: putative toxin-antitoxin system toxin component, PIN family [Aridibacter sp.]